MGKILLAVLVMISMPVGSLSARELKLICGTTLFIVDTSANTVYNKSEGGEPWNNGRFSKREPQSGNSYYSTPCDIDVTTYVHISSEKIEFGYRSVYTHDCGKNYPGPGEYTPQKGGVAEEVDNIIDRLTGSTNFGVRCDPYIGPAIP